MLFNSWNDFEKNMMQAITENYRHLLHSIRQAELAAGRLPGSVRLLAVSKTKPALSLALAYQLGQRHFGESYLQEALLKQKELAHFNITWHFIGPIQANKTRQIARHFSWVHSVDRFKIARRLSDQRASGLPPLNLCLQVNISGEQSKSGVEPDELPALVNEVRKLPRIRLRGVMAIPAPEQDPDRQREPFRKLHEMLRADGENELDTLSMGMSGDYVAAIFEGATIIRVGTGLFGARK